MTKGPAWVSLAGEGPKRSNAFVDNKNAMLYDFAALPRI
jgi:hypothetical protein